MAQSIPEEMKPLLEVFRAYNSFGRKGDQDHMDCRSVLVCKHIFSKRKTWHLQCKVSSTLPAGLFPSFAAKITFSSRQYVQQVTNSVAHYLNVAEKIFFSWLSAVRM